MAYEQFETAGMGAMNLGSEAMARFQTASDMGGFKATKDIEMERRNQEDLAYAQAQRQQQMMKDAQSKQKKKQKTSTLLSLVGTGVGFALGGPGGAAVGGGLGAAAGGVFGQQGGEVPGKFHHSGRKRLEHREDYLSDLEGAIQRAQKPSWGQALHYGAQGVQTGLVAGDLLGKLDTVKMAQSAMEGPGGVSWKEAFKGAGGFGGILGDIGSEVGSLLGMTKGNVETSGTNLYREVTPIQGDLAQKLGEEDTTFAPSFDIDEELADRSFQESIEDLGPAEDVAVAAMDPLNEIFQTPDEAYIAAGGQGPSVPYAMPSAPIQSQWEQILNDPSAFGAWGSSTGK